jgi:hypothetical protein
MEYRELRTLEQAVNTRGSRLWTKMNDDSKAAKQRQIFVQQNGGFFKQDGRYWLWVCPEDEQNGYWLINIHTNQKEFFSNMSKWSEEHGMTPVKVCELLNGKRKTYKGWTAVEHRAVKEGTGSHVNVKKKKPEKVAIMKTVTLRNTKTNEICVVDNIPEFAKARGLDKKSLYKVANGIEKSHKNYKLYNPLEIIENSNSDK